jgi:hypothetical protein
MTSIFLTERQAATYLTIAPKTLARWRYIKTGPRVHRFGSTVRYKVEDLIAFAASSATGGEDQA